MKAMSLILGTLIFSVTVMAQTNTSAEFSALSDMPLEARKAIVMWNNQFRPLEMKDFTSEIRSLFTDLASEAPMRLVADFNGDQINDYALLGENQKQQYVIMVLSGQRWKVVEVEKWSDTNFKSSLIGSAKDKDLKKSAPIYLAKAEGEEANEFKAKNKREALQVETYLGNVRIFGLRNHKIKELNL